MVQGNGKSGFGFEQRAVAREPVVIRNAKPVYGADMTGSASHGVVFLCRVDVARQIGAQDVSEQLVVLIKQSDETAGQGMGNDNFALVVAQADTAPPEGPRPRQLFIHPLVGITKPCVESENLALGRDTYLGGAEVPIAAHKVPDEVGAIGQDRPAVGVRDDARDTILAQKALDRFRAVVG